MKDKDKTQKQLIREMTSLRRRIAELEASERQVKQIGEDLKKSIQERTTVLDSVSELVVYQDTHMRILWANRAAGESVGVDPQQLVGHRCYEIWQQRHRPCVGCPVIKTRKSGKPQEAEITSPDGRVWWIHSYPVRDKKGIVTGIVEITIDITDRKNAEEALLNTRDQLHRLLDASPTIIYSCETRGNFDAIYVSDNIKTIMGYDPEEFLSPGFWAKNIHPEEKSRVFANIDRIFKKGQHYHKYRFRHKDGSWRWMMDELTLVCDRKGKAKEMIGYWQDITERRQAEEALQAERQRLFNILEVMPMMVCLLTADYHVAFANRSFREQFGESHGRHCHDYCFGKKEPCDFCEAYQVLKTGKPHHWEITAPNGSVIDVYDFPFTDVDGSPMILEFDLDITERKQTEEKLRESEKRYKTLFDEAVVGICLGDAETGIITDCNEAMAALVGRERADLIEKSQKILHPPQDDKEIFSHTFKQHLTDKEGQILETQVITKTGDLKEVEIKANLLDLQGRKVLQALFYDITDRKRANEALRESETRFRTLFEAIPDTVLVHDDKGTILHINEIGAERLEWSAKDLVGRNLRDIVTPENFASIADHVKETHKVGWSRFETTYVSRSGWRIIAEVYEHPIIFSQKKAILSVARDITERKQANKKLQESEERFRLAFENANTGVCLVDLEGNLTRVNAKMCEIFGYTKEELERMTVNDIAFPEDIDKSPAFIQKTLKGKIDRATFEKRYIHKKGHVVTCEVSSSLIQNTEGAPLYFISHVHDITERKQAENELRESEERFRIFADEVAFEGLVVHDKGKILDVNRQFAEMHGYEISELFEIDTFFAVAPKSRDRVLKHIQEGYEKPYEAIALRKDGSTFPMEISAKKIPYHGKMVRAAAIRDITERKQAEEQLQESYKQLQNTFITTVNALASTVEMKDQYTAGHQPRVSHLASNIAEEMGLSQKQIESIRMAGLIHDIGKIIVPAEILNKPGPLTDIQYEMVKMHPRAGFDILKGIKFPWPVAQIIFQHHELMDGTGYPQGLAGDQIMLEARVLTVANVVEAMTSHRPYRAAHDITAALDEIKQHKRVLYDPDVVDACLRLFNEKGFTLDSLQEPAPPPMVS
ncbi:MAG: PAS domain S-box protein [Deltaproteobacteria bacterium]|nr:PAS domain S-box protein [Deltaproteobacteria bacterium]